MTTMLFFDDESTLHADNPAWVPIWKGGKTLAALAGRMIRLEVSLDNARLYAVRGDYVECRLSDWHRMLHQGVAPGEDQPWRKI